MTVEGNSQPIYESIPEDIINGPMVPPSCILSVQRAQQGQRIYTPSNTGYNTEMPEFVYNSAYGSSNLHTGQLETAVNTE